MSVTITIVITAIILINIVLWLFFMPWYVDKKISRFQNELVDKHYTEVETMYRKMRGWRHDYHRLASCMFCEDILVFDQGKVVQHGSHDELEKQNGLYRQLWNAQAQYYT